MGRNITRLKLTAAAVKAKPDGRQIKWTRPSIFPSNHTAIEDSIEPNLSFLNVYFGSCILTHAAELRSPYNPLKPEYMQNIAVMSSRMIRKLKV